MRRFAIILFVLVLTSAGCGGSGNDGGAVFVPATGNQFAGTWSGAAADPQDSNQTITMNLSINTAGAVSGTITISGQDTVSLSGSVDRNGNCSFGYTVAGTDYRISGSLSINGAGDQITASMGIDVNNLLHLNFALFVLNKTNS